MNRKKYTLRKKVTSLINKFMVPLDWANYFSKKRQLIRFYQSYSILSYCTPTVNNKILLRLNDTTSSNPLESPEIIANVNSSFLAKGIARNSSLFNLKIFWHILSFFENTKIGFCYAPNKEPSVNSLMPETFMYGSQFINPPLKSDQQYRLNVVDGYKLSILSSCLYLTKTLRVVITHILLLSIFN